MSALPRGWSTTTLGEITESISRGKSPKYTEFSTLPVVNQRSIRWHGIQNEHLKYIHPSQFGAWTKEQYIREGDILWNSTGTGTIGRACLVSLHHLNPPKVVDSHVTIVRPNRAAVDPRFIFAWIRSPAVQHSIEALATGTTSQIELSSRTIANAEIPLAPLNEQRRIADKLDILLKRMNTCREYLDRVPSILKQFRQTVLAAATSGELTIEWRGRNTATWSHERAADICRKVQSGGTPKEGFSNLPGIPFLKVYNIVNQKVNFNYRPQFVEQSVHNGPLAKSKALPGDVLMNIVGPPLGKVAIVPDSFTEWNINQAITLFRPSNRIVTGWLYIVLCSGANVAEIQHETRGSAGQVNISLSQCRDFIFPTPPVNEQAEIVRRVEALFELADRLETSHRNATTSVENLFEATLAKAFRGELVPQDPNDEPASSLLVQLGAATSVGGQTTRPRQKVSPRSQSKRKTGVIMLSRNQVKDSHLVAILKESGALTPEALWLASQLKIDDFYDQLKDEEARGLLKESRKTPDALRLLEATA